jgi:hypothetical protein
MARRPRRGARASVRALCRAQRRPDGPYGRDHQLGETAAADVIWAISTDETPYLRLTNERACSDARCADLIQRFSW